MAPRRRRARPPEIPHRIRLGVYLSRREGRGMAAAAAQIGKSASAWMRDLALAARAAGAPGARP